MIGLHRNKYTKIFAKTSKIIFGILILCSLTRSLWSLSVNRQMMNGEKVEYG